MERSTTTLDDNVQTDQQAAGGHKMVSMESLSVEASGRHKTLTLDYRLLSCNLVEKSISTAQLRVAISDLEVASSADGVLLHAARAMVVHVTHRNLNRRREQARRGSRESEWVGR